jgi:hypothetical protein
MNLLLFNAGDSPDLFSLRERRLEQGLAQLEQVTDFFRAPSARTLTPMLPRAFMAYQNGLTMLPLVLILAAVAGLF